MLRKGIVLGIIILLFFNIVVASTTAYNLKTKTNFLNFEQYYTPSYGDLNNVINNFILNIRCFILDESDIKETIEELQSIIKLFEKCGAKDHMSLRELMPLISKNNDLIYTNENCKVQSRGIGRGIPYGRRGPNVIPIALWEYTEPESVTQVTEGVNNDSLIEGEQKGLVFFLNGGSWDAGSSPYLNSEVDFYGKTPYIYISYPREEPPEKEPPLPPEKPIPPDYETNVKANYTNISWVCRGDPDNGEVTYDVYFSTNLTLVRTMDPSVRILSNLEQGETTHCLGFLNYNTTYYWNVVVLDDENILSGEDDIWSFTTEDGVNHPPDKPYCISPADGEENVDVTTILKWGCSDLDGDTIEYDVFFEDWDPTPKIYIENLDKTELDLAEYEKLEKDVPYYWKIIARDMRGVETEGDTWSFHTGTWQSNTIAPQVSNKKIYEINCNSYYTPVSSIIGRPQKTSNHLYNTIFIDGDDEFTPENGVSNGSGTSDDPYIIQNLDINASNATGIYIRNTIAHFIIRNCSIHDGAINRNNGIDFDNVRNGKIINTYCFNNHHGIYLFESSDNYILSSICTENTGVGIFLFYRSEHNSVVDCISSKNNRQGIFLDDDSDKNELRNCSIYSNSDGVELEFSSNNYIIGLNSQYNRLSGFILDSSSKNSIIYCYSYSNGLEGLDLIQSSSNDISFSQFVSNKMGLGIVYSFKNRISHCNIFGNKDKGMIAGLSILDAKFNYWGTTMSPRFDITKYFAIVIYRPWTILPYVIP
ncbi:MAG: right-handed parallel beta-helix repeat-containing protein [Promethearchaeota archaeon]|jgi:parallel beta-helix repeat protein